MMHTKFFGTIMQVKSSKELLQKRFTLPQICSILKYSKISKKNKTDKDDEIDEYDKPIRYSTSKAAKMSAAYTALPSDRPHYQGLVVTLCMATFMLYFFILREENDIDEMMVKNIPSELLDDIYGKDRLKK